VFIYTREAHPGENVPHHDNLQRKLANAALLAKQTGIGRGGRVAYKANWTSAANVEAFVIRLLAGRAGHPPGTAPVVRDVPVQQSR